jgi:hypothetical protein
MPSGFFHRPLRPQMHERLAQVGARCLRIRAQRLKLLGRSADRQRLDAHSARAQRPDSPPSALTSAASARHG